MKTARKLLDSFEGISETGSPFAPLWREGDLQFAFAKEETALKKETRIND
jgi:hypothetical protein